LAEKSARRSEPGAWVQGDLQCNNFNPFPVTDYSKFSLYSCVELFELMFTNDIFEHLVSESNKYAMFCNNRDPNITVEKLKCFISILIISGYNSLPGKRYYWEDGKDMKNEMVSNAMRRDRFLQISRFIHCADNMNINTKDKMYKLRPLIEKLKVNFLKNFQPYKYLSYDESMIKYYGRHGCKQFLRGKPIRFGYKAWCLTTDFGYLLNFDIYQGKSPNSNTAYEDEYGKAATPLMIMLDDLPDEKKNLSYSIYFDNLFTGFNLLVDLRERGYGGTGTIRDNRIPKSCPISKNSMSKERGEYKSTISREDGLIVVRWVDNSVVSMSSNCHGTEPVSTVRRFSQQQKKFIQVPRPAIIANYNKHMGGVDRMDEDIARYRVGIRGKKWWWPIFTWLLDVAINNAWVLSKKSGSNFTKLEFKREIASTYLTKYGQIGKQGGRPSKSKTSISNSRISDELRYDQMNHWVSEVPNKKRRRCAGDNYKSHVQTMCMKCDLGLCIPCFRVFHEK